MASAWDVLMARPMEGADIEGARAAWAIVICEVPRIWVGWPSCWPEVLRVLMLCGVIAMGCPWEVLAARANGDPLFVIICVCGAMLTIGVATCTGAIDTAFITCG